MSFWFQRCVKFAVAESDFSMNFSTAFHTLVVLWLWRVDDEFSRDRKFCFQCTSFVGDFKDFKCKLSDEFFIENRRLLPAILLDTFSTRVLKAQSDPLSSLSEAE